jgi:hypothetical protein
VAALIDIVGHFGTTFSYATVGSRVARALDEAGRLGLVMNLDAEWHPEHAGLGQRSGGRGSHVLLFTPPNHYVDVFAQQYGRERSAIFMSPNTDWLADEHSMTCAKFGLAIAPSEWCESVVRRHVPDASVALLPLGVDSVYATGREARQKRLRGRAASGTTCDVLHFSTDQSWPGRKGSEELLVAWAMLTHGPMKGRVDRQLLLHIPPGLYRDAMYRVRDLQIDRTVRLFTAKERGSSLGDLTEPFDKADLLVAPSRCEGFGMMLLASLVAGVPLLSTYNTGHRDFLADSPGWLGVPAPDVEAIAREEGWAPAIEPRVLAQSLFVAMQPDARLAMISTSQEWASDHGDWGTWEAVLPRWSERIVEWMEETCPTE